MDSEITAIKDAKVAEVKAAAATARAQADVKNASELQRLKELKQSGLFERNTPSDKTDFTAKRSRRCAMTLAVILAFGSGAFPYQSATISAIDSDALSRSMFMYQPSLAAVNGWRCIQWVTGSMTGEWI